MALGLAAATAVRASDRATLDAADRAWAAGDRRAAAEGWRSAEAAADPAVRAQAAVRLLRVSGNLGMAVHGPRADRALAECPPMVAWCQLAEADYELILADLGLPGDRALAADLAREAAEELPVEAQARLVWAGAAPRVSLPEQGAVAEALQAGDGAWPAGPGTWVVGLGVVGAPGLGVGGSVRLLHPDVGWAGRRLEATATATSRKVVGGALQWATPGRVWWRAEASGFRRPFDQYSSAGVRRTTTLGTLQAVAAPGLRGGGWWGWLGPLGRLDRSGGAWTPGHGGAAGLGWGADPWRLSTRVEASLVGPRHTSAVLDLRLTPPAPGGQWGLWLRGEGAPLATSPVYRLPAVGGGDLLRSVPVGRYRAPALAGAVAEWRSRPWGVVGVAVFAEGAWVVGSGGSLGADLHAGAGGGLRLHLPPRPHNTVRLDAAVGDAGWALTAGFGEAF